MPQTVIAGLPGTANVLPLYSGHEGGIPVLGPSSLTDDGTKLSYKGNAIASSGPVAPTLLYSAAGTPLPAASAALKGASAVVSDANAPTYHGTYTSGGAIVCNVICTGAAWLTH